MLCGISKQHFGSTGQMRINTILQKRSLKQQVSFCELPPFLFISQAVLDDIHALRRFVLTAIDDGYDTTDDWTRDFAFDSTVLFTITIMSTVSKVFF